MKTLNMKSGMTSHLASLTTTEKLQAYLKVCLSAWSLLFGCYIELNSPESRQEPSWHRDLNGTRAKCPILRWTWEMAKINFSAASFCPSDLLVRLLLPPLQINSRSTLGGSVS